MMAEAGHGDDNGDTSSFEFVNGAGNQERSDFIVQESLSSAVTENIQPLPAVPPFAPSTQPQFVVPSLPSFPTSAPPPPPSTSVKDPTPPAIPAPPMASATSPVSNPYSVKAASGANSTLSSAAGHHLPPTALPPTTGLPPSPFVAPPPTPPFTTQPPSSTMFSAPPAPTAGSYGLDMTFDVASGQPNDPSSPLSSFQGSADAGVFGWFNKTISGSNFLSKVAEKAKTSVDSMITTLDPQMKDYMGANDVLELTVVTADVELISAVKTGISRYFPQIIIRGVPPTYSSTHAAQPVGFSNGLAACHEKIQNLRQSGMVSANSVVIAETGFFVEIAENNFYEFYCVVISDIARGIDAHSFSQPVPIPNYVVDLIKQQTPTEYPYISSGFAVNVDQIMVHQHGLGHSTWQEQFGGVCRTDLIKEACVAVGYLYKSRI